MELPGLYGLVDIFSFNRYMVFVRVMFCVAGCGVLISAAGPVAV